MFGLAHGCPAVPNHRINSPGSKGNVSATPPTFGVERPNKLIWVAVPLKTRGEVMVCGFIGVASPFGLSRMAKE
jgi:hypothetical protein